MVFDCKYINIQEREMTYIKRAYKHPNYRMGGIQFYFLFLLWFLSSTLIFIFIDLFISI